MKTKSEALRCEWASCAQIRSYVVVCAQVREVVRATVHASSALVIGCEQHFNNFSLEGAFRAGAALERRSMTNA